LSRQIPFLPFFNPSATQPMRSENETALASSERAILEDRTNGSLDKREVKKKILVRLRLDLDAHRGKLALKQIHGCSSSNPGDDAPPYGVKRK
jgi:hypothetical protein